MVIALHGLYMQLSMISTFARCMDHSLGSCDTNDLIPEALNPSTSETSDNILWVGRPSSRILEIGPDLACIVIFYR
jgi:hypothetical protein